MSITCPACRKVNATQSLCTRCDSDLSDLIRIHRHAVEAMEIGTHHLKSHQPDKALHHACISWNLEHTAAAARLAFFACLMQNEFDTATRWYQCAAMLADGAPPS
ncbi:MAG: hypothetical protein HKP58_12880 [Desulfatitalea sp.]|nr:hypothetical protein [Desulfatitalea sp.]NNK01294.1 hypothetical protein [Desulfatitalea sp.]